MPAVQEKLRELIREHTVLALLFFSQIAFGFYMFMKDAGIRYIPVMITLLVLSTIAYGFAHAIEGNKKIVVWMLILLNIGAIEQTLLGTQSVLKICIFMIISFAAGFLVAGIMYAQKWISWIYNDRFAILLMILTVLVFAVMCFRGSSDGGARVNLVIGTTSIQPLEAVKIFYIFIMAILLCKEECREKISIFKGRFHITRLSAAMLFTILLIGGFCVLSELGTMLLIALTGVGMIFSYGKNRKLVWGFLIAGVLTVAAAILLAWIIVRSGHTLSGPLYKIWTRISIWLNPYSGEDGASHILAIRRAFTMGGIWGPAAERYTTVKIFGQDTDAVFAKLIQTCGLAIAEVAIFAYAMILYEGYWASKKVKDSFYSGLAYAAALVMALQGMVHIGCNCGLLPLTGLPLMFISKGGMNMIVSVVTAMMLIAISSGYMERSTEHETYF